MSSGEQPVEGTNQPTTTAEAPEQQQEATDQPTNGMVKQDAASDEPPPQGMEEQAMTHPAPSEAPAASDAPAADAAAAQAAPSYQETGVSYQPSAYVGGEGAAAAAERHDPQYYASGAVGGRLPAALNDQERNPNKVFVGGLGTCTTSETIRAHFSKFGEIIDAAVVCEKHSGRSRGFAFVLFRDAHSVEACIREKHKIDGVACDVRHAVPREEARETPAYDTIQHPAKIFVGGLPEELDETEFRAVFERIGRVKEATLMYDKFSHKPRGFGFVIFEEHHVAERAIGMHNIKGRECEAKRAQPRDQNDPRRMGRGGYGYGGRGGGGRGYDSFGSPPYSRGGGRGFGRGYDAYGGGYGLSPSNGAYPSSSAGHAGAGGMVAGLGTAIGVTGAAAAGPAAHPHPWAAHQQPTVIGGAAGQHGAPAAAAAPGGVFPAPGAQPTAPGMYYGAWGYQDPNAAAFYGYGGYPGAAAGAYGAPQPGVTLPNPYDQTSYAYGAAAGGPQRDPRTQHRTTPY